MSYACICDGTKEKKEKEKEKDVLFIAINQTRTGK